MKEIKEVIAALLNVALLMLYLTIKLLGRSIVLIFKGNWPKQAVKKAVAEERQKIDAEYEVKRLYWQREREEVIRRYRELRSNRTSQ